MYLAGSQEECDGESNGSALKCSNQLKLGFET